MSSDRARDREGERSEFERSVPSDGTASRPGRNGGRLRTGNPREARSATREREHFLASMRRLMNSPATVKAVTKVLANPNHRHFAMIARLAAEYSWGRATQFVDLTTHEPANAEQVREKILSQLEQIAERTRLARSIVAAPDALREASAGDGNHQPPGERQ